MTQIDIEEVLGNRCQAKWGQHQKNQKKEMLHKLKKQIERQRMIIVREQSQLHTMEQQAKRLKSEIEGNN